VEEHEMLEKSAGAVTFVYEPGSRGCSAVSVAGEFNGWQAGATPLSRGDDGRWRARVELTPGEHQFKYVVDGDWINDPLADGQSANPLGGSNSIVRVEPAPAPVVAASPVAPAPVFEPAPAPVGNAAPAPVAPARVAPVIETPSPLPPFLRPKNTGFFNRVKRIFIRSKD